MKRSRFEKWLQNIFKTSEEEISCSECIDLIPAYVDLEISKGSPEGKPSQIEQHLNQCQVCHEEYMLLLDLARWEARKEDPF